MESVSVTMTQEPPAGGSWASQLLALKQFEITMDLCATSLEVVALMFGEDARLRRTSRLGRKRWVW